MADLEKCADCSTSEVLASTMDPFPKANDTASPVVENPLDPATFVSPDPLPLPNITIEFCDRCRWLHRATWVSTELMLTFPTPTIKAVTLLPLSSEGTAGRFRVWLNFAERPILVWDRKVEGGFPELKILKQRIRDYVQPGKSLGHSDK